MKTLATMMLLLATTATDASALTDQEAFVKFSAKLVQTDVAAKPKAMCNCQTTFSVRSVPSVGKSGARGSCRPGTRPSCRPSWRARPAENGVRIATPEDLIVLKLIAGRPKDEIDLLGLVRLPDLDWPYVERWAVEWQVAARREEIRRRVAAEPA